MKNNYSYHWVLIISFLCGIGIPQMKANDPLTLLLDKMSDRYQTIFSYETDLINGVEVDFEFRDEEDVYAAVDRLFSMTNFKYEILNAKYVIVYRNTRQSKKKVRKLRKKFKEINNIESSGFLSIMPKAKNVIGKLKAIINMDKTIDGTVTDEDGEALIGVLIRISGKGTGTTTDINGNFEIDIIDEDDLILEVSYLGYKTQRIKVDNRDFINIVLEVHSHKLDEVVVTGFQTLNKGRSTGSFSKLGAVELDDLFSENLTDKLEGRLPGLLVNPDGSIVIRGTSSFLGIDEDDNNLNTITNLATGNVIQAFKDQNKPLLVVDGFPIEADISTLNTNEIESITILKDAAAAAIWGVRAAHGVIVAVTKKPKGDRLNITFSAHTGFKLKPDFSQFHLMSGSDMVDYDVYHAENYGDVWFNSPIPGAANIVLKRDAGDISEQDADQMLNELRSTDNRQQVEDAVFRNGLYQNYNLSIRHAAKNTSTVFSLQHTNDETAFVGNENSKTIFDAKIYLRPVNWLNVDFGYTGSYGQANLNNKWGTIYSPRSSLKTYDRIYDDNGSFAYMFTPGGFRGREQGMHAINQDRAIGLEEQGYLNWRYNYIEEQERSDISSTDFENRFLARVHINPLKFLSFESGIQIEVNNNFQEFSFDPESHIVRSLINFYTTINTDGQLINNYRNNEGGLYSKYENKLTNIHSRNQLTFDHIIKHKHRVTALAGIELKNARNDYQYNSLYNYRERSGLSTILDPDLLSNASLNYRNARFGVHPLKSGEIGGGIRNDNPRDLGYYSTLSYSYNDTYSSTFSYRIDESNLFGVLPELRRNKLWSAGVSWLISQESFFKSSSIDFLKVRATYGYTGNVDRDGATSLLVSAQDDNYYEYTDVLIPQSPANITYRPERTKDINIGMDGTAFKNRLNFSLDLYHRNHYDLISAKELESTNGWTSGRINDGIMVNKGLELALGFLVLNRARLKWDINLAFAYNINTVTETNLIPPSFFDRPEKRVGYPLHSIWSLPYEGLDENGGAIVNNSFTGERVDISNGPFAVDNQIWIHSGQYDPKYSGGIQNTFTFDNLSLGFNITYKGGHKYILPASEWIGDEHYSPGQFAVDHWRKPGDEEFTDIPHDNKENYDLYETANLWAQAESRIEDATLVRVRNINLGYNLPKKWLSKAGIGDVKLSAQLENPFLWTKSSFDYDPDYVSRFEGSGVLGYQTGFAQKSVLIGIKMTY